MRRMEMHGTIVIGAGVIGASIAYHLAARGEAVTVVDAALPASGATRNSFAWISPFGGPGGPASGLRELSTHDWHRLGEEIPGLDPVWSGALTWGEEFAREHADAVTPPADVEPRLSRIPSRATFSPDEGWIDPVSATEQLIDAARHHGGQTKFGEPVLRLVNDERRGVVGVDLGHALLGASTVIIAAGTGSAALSGSLGIALPMTPAPAILVRLAAPPGLVARIVANDDFEVRQDPAGTILVPLSYSGEDSAASLARAGEEARRRLADAFAGGEDARIISVDVGWRPMLSDHEPAVGSTAVRGLYVAVAHPGVTLAATIGRLVAQEITTSELAPELARYRPTRFR